MSEVYFKLEQEPEKDNPETVRPDRTAQRYCSKDEMLKKIIGAREKPAEQKISADAPLASKEVKLRDADCPELHVVESAQFLKQLDAEYHTLPDETDSSQDNHTEKTKEPTPPLKKIALDKDASPHSRIDTWAHPFYNFVDRKNEFYIYYAGQEHRQELYGNPGQTVHTYFPSKEDEYVLGEKAKKREGPALFTLEELIGSGGFGEVWKARFDTGETVAVKYCEDGMDEMVIAAGLDHDNITRIIGCGEDANGKFIVREYVQGKSLQEILEKEGKLDYETVMGIAGQVAKAVSYLHSQGIVHGDIKPENILIPDNPEEDVKVTDFGLSRRIKTGVEQSVRVTSVIEGTAKYMAPELFYPDNNDETKQKEPTKKSDVYSLGKLLIKALTGELVNFRGMSSKQKLNDDKRALALQDYLENTCLNPIAELRNGVESLREKLEHTVTKEITSSIYEWIKPHLEEAERKRLCEGFDEALRLTKSEWGVGRAIAALIPGYGLYAGLRNAKQLWGETGFMEGPFHNLLFNGMTLPLDALLIYALRNPAESSVDTAAGISAFFAMRAIICFIGDHQKHQLLLENSYCKMK